MRNIVALARKECANYSVSGPANIKDYCYQEPRNTEFKCRVVCGKPCLYFQTSVLPRKPELSLEWNAFCDGDSGVNAEDLKLKQCQCGKMFEPNSNRHTFCEDCSLKNKKKMTRERVQKNRDKKRVRE